jgi:hypothetical protein
MKNAVIGKSKKERVQKEQRKINLMEGMEETMKK